MHSFRTHAVSITFSMGVYFFVVLCGILSWQLGSINFWPSDRLGAMYLMTTLAIVLTMIFAAKIAIKKILFTASG